MTGPVVDEALLRRAVWCVVATRAQRARRSPRARPLWSFVGRHLGLGSTSAAAVCTDFGFHHDTGEVLRERGWERPDEAGASEDWLRDTGSDDA